MKITDAASLGNAIRTRRMELLEALKKSAGKLEEKGFARAGDIADKIEKGIKKCKEKLSLFYR